MRKESLAFLTELVAAPSPSGYEQPAQRVFKTYIAPYAQLSTDVMGNVYGAIPAGKGAPTVMLVGHSDEIGLQVRHVDEQGFIWFAAIGGVDPHLTPGLAVRVHSRDGSFVRGVIGRKPIHLLEPKDRDAVVKLDAQYIDIGAANREEAEKYAELGAPITFDAELTPMLGSRVTGRGLDDKAGSFIVAEVLRQVAKKKLAVNLVGVSSVQEEVGLRGGTVSAYNVNPDIGICVEVGFATDQPDVDAKKHGTAVLGKGPIIARGPNINPVLFDLIVETAKQAKIPFQLAATQRPSGTDANVMQVSRGGVATSLISIPLRYMHSPVEVVDLDDLDNTAKLLVAVLARIKSKEMFIPV